ncbi:MAG: hypothetical protein CVU95_09175 [Firmicutes bacterium HGW-Firmicutes-2]|jgi:type IV pilus assembly protein PilA|nr:MAG: hypothetical protein CVU95_09175 [Firmicutes bacterium HGW-Firmicutes-2]
MRELFKRVFKKEEGFSLIELIIVIAILAIIAAIAVPNLISNIQRANEGTDIANAKLIGDAIATVIAQNPDLEGTAFADVPFTAAGADSLAATNAAGEDLIDFALATMTSGVPQLKFSDHRGAGATGDDFLVTLTADGVITVEDNAGTTQLFPQ